MTQETENKAVGVTNEPDWENATEVEKEIDGLETDLRFSRDIFYKYPEIDFDAATEGLIKAIKIIKRQNGYEDKPIAAQLKGDKINATTKSL